MKRSYIREILDCINEDTISFAGGLPSSTNFPLKQLEESSTLAFKDANVLQYASSNGLLSLREKIASWYTTYLDFPTSPEEIIITSGSQQAFDMISKACIKKEIFVEEPSYIGALNAYRLLNLDIKGFKKVQDLKQGLNKHNAVYTMTSFQNPSTTSYTQEEKMDFLNILEEKKSLLIEDDAYMFLAFNGNINKPLSASYENSFHLGSFSKIISPGLRVGWIRAKKKDLDKVLVIKEALDLHTSSLSQHIINNYLENNNIFSHLKEIRKDYENKMVFMSRCLKKYLPSFSFEEPKGGMFIYGSFECDSFLLAKKALDNNVAFVPASVFFHDNRKSKQARFNFSNASLEEIEKGIIRLGKLL